MDYSSFSPQQSDEHKYEPQTFITRSTAASVVS